VKAVATAEGAGPLKLTLIVECGAAVPQPTDPGTDPPPVVVPPTGYDMATNALLMEAFANLDLLGEPGQVQLSPLGFPPTWSAPISGFERQTSSYRWTGAIVAPASGVFQFTVEVKSGGHVIFDGDVIWSLDREPDATSSSAFATVAWERTLEKGRVYPVSFAVVYQGFLAGLSAFWKQPGKDAPEPISMLFIRPPSNWRDRLKTYQPPPPPPSAFLEPNWATYQSPATGPLLAADSPLVARIDTMQVDPLSDRIIAGLGTAWLHPVFGESGNGIPYEIVPPGEAKVAVGFDYAGESDPGPYPLPALPLVEGGAGDKHWLGIDRAGNQLYELFLLRKENGAWRAGSGAIYPLDRHHDRPLGWTSADAAGLPILPLLATYDEAASGEINHALRISVGKTRRGFVYPARHFTQKYGNDEGLLPMGAKLRLKASVDISAAPPVVRAILIAAKRHGLIVADNGSESFIGLCGAPDARWDDDELAWMKRLLATDFEVVTMGEVITEVP
jgi:hypothetical protein